jgi:diacylglycerol O-acyltransferase / wax synthase
MLQLSGLDTSFLSMETPSQYGHVASLAVFELDGWAHAGTFFETIVKVVEQRIHLLPLLRRRLVEVPFGLDHPYWVDDPDFDLEFHVRNLALPSPGTDQQLADQVARLAARALDRSSPLWELYVIDGLAGNRAAIFTKIHHATIDGMQGVEVLTTLLDTDPGGRVLGRPTKAWTGEALPSPASMLARTALSYGRNPVRATKLSLRSAQAAAGIARSSGVRSLARMLRVPSMESAIESVPCAETVTKVLTGRRNPSEHFPLMTGRPAPKTPFNKSVTPHRRYAFRSLSLDEAKLVKQTFGVTVNDVVLAVCAGALRAWLHHHDALPAEALVAMVPVSVQSGDPNDPYSMKVAAVLTSLHTDVADPVQRLQAIHASVLAAKGMHAAVPADLLTDLAHFAPPAVFARASRLTMRTGVLNRINAPFNLTISNVPGPSTQLYCGGARLAQFYPVSSVVDGQGLNITVQSYQGRLDFGVISCRELVPDAWHLMDLLTEAQAELVALAAPPARPAKRPPRAAGGAPSRAAGRSKVKVA